MATATATKTTLELACPECGAVCGMILHTDDLTTVECSECNESFDPHAAAEVLASAAAKWQRFTLWLDGAAAV